jgi:hypothetical protein
MTNSAAEPASRGNVSFFERLSLAGKLCRRDPDVLAVVQRWTAFRVADTF